MATLFSEDFSGVAEGAAVGTGNTGLTAATSGFVGRAPVDATPPVPMTAQREATASGTMTWDPAGTVIKADGTLYASAVLTYGIREVTGAAVCEQMLDTAGTPLAAIILNTSRGFALRDQTTAKWTSEAGILTVGQAFRMDLAINQVEAWAEARCYPDAAAADVVESGRVALVNNVNDPASQVRWGLAAAQTSLIGFQVANLLVAEEWPAAPGGGPGPSVRFPAWVKRGEDWVPTAGAAIYDGATGSWQSAVGHTVWKGPLGWMAWDTVAGQWVPYAG